MSLKLQDEGLKRKLEDLRAAWNSTALKMHLYKNNYTPLDTSVVGDFTECDFPNYSAQNIVTWGAATVTSHVGKITAAANTFTRSTTGTAQNVYGYYITDSAGTLLYWAELQPGGPTVLTNAGDAVSVIAVMQDQNA